MSRFHNFNAGPAVLPLPVLERVRDELVELPEQGASVMELSHRSKAFENIIHSAENRMRALLGLSDDYRVLFLQGGASLQFAMAPMNLLGGENKRAGYLISGDWGRKAVKEAQPFGEVQVLASTQEGGFRRVPNADEIGASEGLRYVHFTSNETIQGVQWTREPDVNAPLMCDASSDILSRPIGAERYGLIYAGAQKNVGPSGVTIVIVREDWLPKTSGLPTMLDYQTHLKSGSLYNTPNTFGIYLVDLVCEWIQNLGGLNAMQAINEQKANLIYDVIDSSNGFYVGHAELGSRSRMNVTFRLQNEALEKQFLTEASGENMMGLPGHRDVGGVRASLYNALPLESARILSEFMRDFAQRNG